MGTTQSTETVALTGAQLKVTLGGLGLPPAWFGDELGVTMRTVVRWFDGDPIPSRAVEKLEQLAAFTLDEMRAMVKAEPEYLEDKRALYTYRTDKKFDSPMPASWHRALTFRVAEHIRTQGEQIVIEYIDPIKRG